MGDSSRDKAANQMGGDLNRFKGKIEQQNFGTQNRFDSYKSPFGYNQMKNNLDNVFNDQSNDIKRQFSTDTNNSVQSLSSRLASQGIKGGSIFNTAQSDINNKGNIAKSDALTRLGIAKSDANNDLMRYANDDQFRTTSAAQGIDIQNALALARKYGLLQNTMGMQMQNIGNMDDTNWGDVLGQGLGMLSQIALAPTTGGGSLIGGLLGKG